MKGSRKQKAEVLMQDFFNKAKYGNLVCKGIRKTLHYSQSTMAQKLHYGHMIISDFENDVAMNCDKIYEIYKAYQTVLYEVYAKLDEKDYILFVLRIICNYGTVLHEEDKDDDNLVSKFISILSGLYSEAAT